MMSEREAEARLLAAAFMLKQVLPDLNNMPFGDIAIMAQIRTRELVRDEPTHLRPDQLVELYCLEVIEAVKIHRRAAGLE